MSDASWYHHRGAQRTLQNILFHRSWLVEWSSHPHPECWIPVNLQATTENSSLSTLLDFILNVKKKQSFSLFIPSLVSLYLFEQCLRLCVTSTSSVCLPLQDESLHLFPNCKSLWIKASAKCNVNLTWQMRYNLGIAIIKSDLLNINSNVPFLSFYSMASIDCYLKTTIFWHQIGSAHKKHLPCNCL